MSLKWYKIQTVTKKDTITESRGLLDDINTDDLERSLLPFETF